MPVGDAPQWRRFFSWACLIRWVPIFFFFFGRKDVSFLSINKKTNYVLLLFLNTTEVWFGDNVEAKHYT